MKNIIQRYLFICTFVLFTFSTAHSISTQSILSDFAAKNNCSVTMWDFFAARTPFINDIKIYESSLVEIIENATLVHSGNTVRSHFSLGSSPKSRSGFGNSIPSRLGGIDLSISNYSNSSLTLSITYTNNYGAHRVIAGNNSYIKFNLNNPSNELIIFNKTRYLKLKCL